MTFPYCDATYRLVVRLRVVSNFGDLDCGAGEIHIRARAKFRGDATRGERQKLESVYLVVLLFKKFAVFLSHIIKKYTKGILFYWLIKCSGTVIDQRPIEGEGG